MSFTVKSLAIALAAVALLAEGCSKPEEPAGRSGVEDGAIAADLADHMSTRQLEDLQVWLAERRLEKLSPERQARIKFLIEGELKLEREREMEAHQ